MKIRSAVLLGVIVAVIIIFAPRVFAHEAPTGWTYPVACCSNKDCQMVSNDAIHEPDSVDPNYVIRLTNERIDPRDRRVQFSPDGMFHWCAAQDGDRRTICLFVPLKSI